MESHSPQYFDIAANLTDLRFQGIYNSKMYHSCDLERVFKRCQQFNVSHLLIASGDTEDLLKAYSLCKKSSTFYTTAGLHPCRANQAVDNLPEYFADLEAKINQYRDKGIFWHPLDSAFFI